MTALLLLLSLCQVAWAATDEVPSEISLADQLVAQARQMETTQVDEAINMMLSKEKAMLEISSSAEQARFYNKLAELNSTIGRLDDQQKYAEKGLAILGNETVPVAAELHYNLGLVHESRTEYIKARERYDQGLLIAQTTGSRIYQGRGRLYIAALYTSQRDYAKALEHMREAYAIAEEVNNPELTWETLNESGLLYGYIDKGEQALDFYTRAIDAAKALQMKELVIVSLYNAGVTNLELKRHDAANVMFEQMLAESKSSTELSNMYNSYKAFAMSSRDNEQYERAFSYINKAEEYLPHIQQILMRVEHYTFKAELLNELEQTNRALEVLAIAERLLPEGLHGSNSISASNILWLKAKFYEELRQFEKAHTLLKQYVRGYHELRNKEVESQELKMRVSFDMERNEVRNDILEKDNKIKALQLQQAKNERQIQTFFLIALALLSLGLIFVMYRQLHSRRKLKTIAQTDSLTELFNRRYAFAKGETLVSQCVQTEKPMSIFLFDLDHFKVVNDTYGHPAGDQVLKLVAQVSKNCLRGTDVLARIGGEEFIAILPGVDLEMAEFIAGRLKEKLESCQHEFEGNKFIVTASFGVATVNNDDDFEALTQRADKALYNAKDNGRNCVALAQ